MFTYKFCPKCQKRNHKKHAHCVRCGDQLFNNPKFGINVFAVTLSIVVLLSAASVYAGKSYFSLKSDVSQPNTQVQNVELKQEDAKPVASPESVKEETTTVPVVQTPTKKETATTPPPAVAPVCDELQKQIYTQTFTVNFNDAKTEMKRLTDGVFAKKNYDTQEAELNKITNDFIDKTNLYYSQYLQNMKNVNCPAEQLLQLKD